MNRRDLFKTTAAAAAWLWGVKPEQPEVLGYSSCYVKTERWKLVFSTRKGDVSTAQHGSETFRGTLDECMAWLEARGVE